MKIDYNQGTRVSDSLVLSNTAITFDMSESGLGLYVFRPLAEGETLRIPQEIIKEPYRLATVRWVSKVSDDLYKAGLIFVR